MSIARPDRPENRPKAEPRGKWISTSEGKRQVRRFNSSVFALVMILLVGSSPSPAQALDASALMQGLDIAVPGQPPQTMPLDEAMRTLNGTVRLTGE
jgi:hypothetical protein